MLTFLKRTCIFTAAAVVLFSTSNLNAFPMIDGIVERVIDGDTVVFNSSKFSSNDINLLEANWGVNSFDADMGSVHVRMVGMDTPETHFRDSSGNYISQGSYGDSATSALKKLVGKNRVTLENQGFDKYKRTLGRIIKNGKDLHLEMLTQGHAVTYFFCAEDCDTDFLTVNHIAQYANACKEAKSQGRGIWNTSDPLPEMPFEFRMRHTQSEPNKLVGDFDTMKLHSPKDYKKIHPCSRIFFTSRAAAIALGFN